MTSPMPEFEDFDWSMPPMQDLLFRTEQERLAQIKRFGHQHHPMVTSGAAHWTYLAQETHYKNAWARQDSLGIISWDTVLLEEVYEALAERDPAKQVEELVQVAAVALAMAEDLMTTKEES